MNSVQSKMAVVIISSRPMPEEFGGQDFADPA